tara:strand:+ start:1373 stop:1876 length:504 start_codon:yes stop_codon:yes gene_type:complete
MEERETKWTPMKALGKAQKEVDSLGLPPLAVDLEDNNTLEFSKLNTYDNKILADFLAMYGGYKAYLETKIADIESKVGALNAAFDEGYSTALYRTVQLYEEKDKKKPTRDELKGEIMDTHAVLREMRREIIDQEATLKKTQGLLNTYTTAYNTVSRIVTIRTHGERI